jgi:hypothetical protein
LVISILVFNGCVSLRRSAEIKRAVFLPPIRGDPWAERPLCRRAVCREGRLRRPVRANRHCYDLAFPSTKGISVTAARELADQMFFLQTDFDKSGFVDVGTFERDNRRYTFQNAITV